MRATPALLLSFALAACGTAAEVDDSGNDAVVEQLGKADTPTDVAGIYEDRAATWSKNDIGTLQLFDDGRWVRGTCLDSGCQTWAQQDGHYVLTRSSGGTRYLQFYAGGTSLTVGWKPAKKDLQDTYAYTRTSAGLKLRKAYFSRTFTVSSVSASDLCAENGGTWSTSKSSCACGAGYQWVPGLGGCAADPQPSESQCDDTSGSWTDDDSNLIGTFCDCGAKRYWVPGTGCVDF